MPGGVNGKIGLRRRDRRNNMVARIAASEIDEAPSPKPGRTGSGHAEAKARAKRLVFDKRSAMARKRS
jgi:hypothetical protein